MNEELQIQEQIQQLEAVVKSRMTKDALERYGNVKIAFPERAIQALVVISQMLQLGRIEQVDDAYLKEVLKRLTPEKREFRVTRK